MGWERRWRERPGFCESVVVSSGLCFIYLDRLYIIRVVLHWISSLISPWIGCFVFLDWRFVSPCSFSNNFVCQVSCLWTHDFLIVFPCPLLSVLPSLLLCFGYLVVLRMCCSVSVFLICFHVIYSLWIFGLIIYSWIISRSVSGLYCVL